ncbi:disulfide bond formation protein B [Nitrosomonas sp. JL21]|uniref:disulfide bond formation protein B n=1 Tax=Nitrosomonas sp. JL21 TaxID=153949 RepID=UPI00136A2518|nr:disulfide bond formation protein B [Nitrosomonas sp. JL21]MBL8498682.1 disulfide bond formation protein B [Nitrosomonas sp.]MXS77484.1 disulfide bond formation protein B [Nitrosomonas sp. JL21]
MRLIYLFILLSCIGLLGYAQYLQQEEGLLPCPLCVAQRVVYWLLGLTALLAFIHSPDIWGRRFYGTLMSAFASVGAIIATRHAWLIRYPESFECGISPEEAFLNALPIAEWWPGMFEANGDCASIEWKFLSLTIPDWSLIAFISLGTLAFYTLVIKNNEKTS